MGVLFLKVSQYKQDAEHGIVVGLSVDKDPSWDALTAAATPVIPAETDVPNPRRQVVRTVKLQWQKTEIVVFRVSEPGCWADKIETVVVTVEPAWDPTNPDTALILGFTLRMETLDLVIECMEGKLSVAVLSPVLMRVGKSDFDQCEALVGNQTRCMLRKGARDWCPIHREWYQFLHNEQLMNRKRCHEKLMRPFCKRGGNIMFHNAVYNNIQTSLAARIILAEVLNAGKEDSKQLKLFETTKKNRDIISRQLVAHDSDGSGRVPISSIINVFLDQMKDRESKPESRDVWQDATIVNLRDVDSLQNPRGWDGFRAPSDVFGAASAAALRDHLLQHAERHGNLPDLLPGPPPPPFEIPIPLTEGQQRWYWGEDSA